MTKNFKSKKIREVRKELTNFLKSQDGISKVKQDGECILFEVNNGIKLIACIAHDGTVTDKETKEVSNFFQLSLRRFVRINRKQFKKAANALAIFGVAIMHEKEDIYQLICPVGSSCDDISSIYNLNGGIIQMIKSGKAVYEALEE